ncbi:hypothetical protein BH11ACT3_BH11ACT3_03150 [soil metagenome]
MRGGHNKHVDPDLDDTVMPDVEVTRPPAKHAAPRFDPARVIPVPPPEPTELPPHRLRMADGVTVHLDLTVFLGRDPSVPRVAADRRVRLVTVPSPGKQVSASHLEVRTTGDTIVATDMLSTNGSVVTVPGSAPRTLLRGESAVLTPGTLIDLGDGNVLELLGPDLHAALPDVALPDGALPDVTSEGAQ